jgi:hypothetical protein
VIFDIVVGIILAYAVMHILYIAVCLVFALFD